MNFTNRTKLHVVWCRAQAGAPGGYPQMAPAERIQVPHPSLGVLVWEM